MITAAFSAGQTDYVDALNALVAELNATAPGATWAAVGRLQKSVAGAGPVNLTVAECFNQFIEFTGALTANMFVRFPTQAGSYFIYNNTTGAFTLTCNTLIGGGVAIPQGKRALIQCDGTNVLQPFTHIPDALTVTGSATFSGAHSITASSSQVVVTGGNVDGTLVYQIYGGGNTGAAFYGSSDAGGIGNAANATLKLGKANGTGRSLNAVGTINASGADYAEYHRRAEGCGVVAKGQIIGFDAGGRITDKFSEARSFGVKSTNPNLVGGDTWGSEAAVGSRPVAPTETDAGGEIDTQAIVDYKIALAAFDGRLEIERQKYDRIAYSGVVPVNVFGSASGDYILAVEGSADSIVGAVMSRSDMASNMHRYLDAVGRVHRVLDDGRAEIAVIVH